jgi:uncharacterized protein YggE
MKRVLTFLGLVLGLTTATFAQRSDPPNTPMITVRGEGQVRVAPDEATVRIGILKQAPAAQVAQEQANTLANGILAALTKSGIPNNQIQTSRLTLSPVYAPRGNDINATPRIIAYQAANVVAVHLLDLTKVGAVIDASLSAGANEIQGVQFGLRDEVAATQQALKQAVSEAQRKAETIAEGVHAQLGPPMEIDENGGPIIYPRAEFESAMIRTAAAAAPTPVSSGEIEVRATVTIRYRIVGFTSKP